MRTAWVLALAAAALVACAAPKPVVAPPPEVEAPEVQGAAGGSGEENLNPNQLTGVPGIDNPQDLEEIGRAHV